ncbi:MAG: DUF1460 domain-containing protein [Bacteroidia bacterium]|nr:DUF1460 domain-containing protein [Bacteroidia bacterium]
MKWILFLLFAIGFACTPTAEKSKADLSENVAFQPEDMAILSEVISLFSGEKDIPTTELMVKVGTFFKETPYVAHTLEMEPEQLVVNLREMDCTTFAENCLAIARTIKSDNPGFETFTRELRHIRYRDGKINGYLSRLHYFSDWIYDNEKKKTVKDVSKEITQTPCPVFVNFMSTHSGSYSQLKDSTLIPYISSTEKEISARKMYYIPKNNIAEIENHLMNGDIAGITTDISGLDISHVVLLVKVNGRMHILHASSAEGKVVLSETSLEDYLKNSKHSTGIMVARPL